MLNELISNIICNACKMFQYVVYNWKTLLMNKINFQNPEFEKEEVIIIVYLFKSTYLMIINEIFIICI